ncbi:MAG: hypothetical protein GXP02_08120 [Alphaproteobacteria bacterium]|nr:hypothetical protein [Alphaproteobacteria bacterium]
MTNFVSAYNFMDLLKDKGFVPQTDVNSFSFGAILNRLAGRLSSGIELSTRHYDFMDLLHDKGFIPEPSNDNSPNIRVA